MNKNKGYYSWIHSLKNAAMQSQEKAFEMLKEAREMGKDEELQASLKAAKAKAGFDKFVKNVQPISNDASDVAQDSEDYVMGGNVSIPHREDDEAIGDQYLTRVPTSRLPNIQAGTFPPPSGVHPPPQFPTPEAAAAEVSRLNAPRRAAVEQAQTRAFHQQEATKAAKEAVEAARKAGKGPKGQRAAAMKAVEDYKNLRRQEMLAEPPERYTEVVTPEGHRMHLPMESVSQKIDRLLNG